MIGLRPMPLDEEGPYTIHLMEWSDVVPLASTICEMDRLELELLGKTPEEAFSIGMQTGAYVARHLGVPVAAFGVNRESKPAAIWFLGSDARFETPIAFQRLSKRWLDFLCADEWVGNIVPVTHKKTIRWLRSLDFSFDPMPYRYRGSDFYRFLKGPKGESLRH